MIPTDQIGQRLLLAFSGKNELPKAILEAIEEFKPAGFTLFRSMNIDSPSQVRHLVTLLQNKAAELQIPGFLIGLDQEGGQLMAVGDATPLPGNMALGATRDSKLAYEAGRVIGTEMSALGVNLVYAPCADVNNNPLNPVVGIRSFGDDPVLVSEMTRAVIEGIQSCGVIATVKHFPGHGDTSTDSHHGLGVVPHPIERLRQVELPPFAAAIEAEVGMLMTAHLGIESIDGENPPPATLSHKVLTNLLREELGFKGVVVSDSMNMQAIQQGEALRGEVVKAAIAGVDLVMITSDPKDQRRAYEGLAAALEQGVLSESEMDVSLRRIENLKKWVSENFVQNDIDLIRCSKHLEIAEEIAEKSITLVRNQENLIPLNLPSEKKIVVVTPMPEDMTPADTSSYVKPVLTESIRHYHPNTAEIQVGVEPTIDEINRIVKSVQEYDLVILGTINAYAIEKQQVLVNKILDSGIPTILVALRLPYDAMTFPEASTILCTYGILEPSMKAAADVIFGQISAKGISPVKLV